VCVCAHTFAHKFAHKSRTNSRTSGAQVAHKQPEFARKRRNSKEISPAYGARPTHLSLCARRHCHGQNPLFFLIYGAPPNPFPLAGWQHSPLPVIIAPQRLPLAPWAVPRGPTWCSPWRAPPPRPGGGALWAFERLMLGAEG